MPLALAVAERWLLHAAEDGTILTAPTRENYYYHHTPSVVHYDSILVQELADFIVAARDFHFLKFKSVCMEHVHALNATQAHAIIVRLAK